MDERDRPPDCPRGSLLAFAKAWRRTSGRAVLLSCHYDVIPRLQPDWIRHCDGNSAERVFIDAQGSRLKFVKRTELLAASLSRIII